MTKENRTWKGGVNKQTNKQITLKRNTWKKEENRTLLHEEYYLE